MKNSVVGFWSQVAVNIGVVATLASASLAAFAQGTVVSTEVSVQNLKESILKISRENTTNLTNWPEVRAELNPLIEQLKQSAGPQDAEYVNEKRAGVWKQSWTDDADLLRGETQNFKTDFSRIFQVVLPNGYFYNMSERVPFAGRLSAFLRGAYSRTDTGIDIEFVNLQSKLGGFGDGENLLDLAYRLETNSVFGVFKPPFEAKYPKGPIGAKGSLQNLYIDDEIRIDLGVNKEDNIQDLYVLEKVIQK
jgi:PAP_fibrillin